MATAEKRLEELKLTLPTAPKPVAKYDGADGQPALRLRTWAGEGCRRLAVLGQVGTDLTVEQGKEIHRLVGLNILATVRNHLGSLDQVKRLVKTLGLVNAPAGFTQHPQVINGFSELLAQIFGDDAGVGVRSAVGASSLPGNMPVEIECVFEVL